MRPYVYLLGVPNFANYEATAALIRIPRAGGDIEYVSVGEERLARTKHTYAFPLRGIHHCLQAFGLESLEEVDYIYTDHARLARWINSGPGYRKLEHDYIKLRLNYPRQRIRVIDHHDAHAASTFYPSPFEEAAILVVDSLGSRLNTQTLYHGTPEGVRVIERGDRWGIGRIYSLVTKAVLPYGPEQGFGKTMGLAPYGRNHPGPVLHFNVRDEGMTSDYSAFATRAPLPRIVAPGVRRCENREAVLDPYFARAAYDVQQECERQMIRMARYAFERTGSRNICLAGGTALNGLANARVLEESGFDNIFIPPGCSDTGLSLGLALWGCFQDVVPQLSRRVSVSMTTAYTGRPYDVAETGALLKRHDVEFRAADPEDIAPLIAGGKVIGWFEGGSESGPRALGHRSILADPRDPAMKDTLNRRVKFRESYRPYAPSILAEHAGEWLHLNADSPFMLLVVEVRADKRERVPAVTHVDNTTRPQTVTGAANPNYYRMIREFHRLTGVPMVLNTSLNVNREPIVETPVDALICAFGTAIDFLYLDGLLVDCVRYRDPELVKRLTEERAVTLDEEWKTITQKYLVRYDVKERDAYLQEENRIAEWHRDYRAKYELERRILDWTSRNSSIVIAGTRGHTGCLYQYVAGFPDLRVSAFVPMDDRPGEPGELGLYDERSLAAVDWSTVDAVLISTHEYEDEVRAAVAAVAPAGVEIFAMYDDAGDSLLHVLPGRWPVINPIGGRHSVPVVRASVDFEFAPEPVAMTERYALIVSYHYCHPDEGFLKGTKSITPDAFDAHLRILRQNFVCTTVGELFNPRASLPETVAVVTFDDGFKDVIEHALPLLQRWDVPATVYGSSAPLLERRVLDVHRSHLLHARLGPAKFHEEFERALDEHGPYAIEPAARLGLKDLYIYDDERTRRFKKLLNFELPYPLLGKILATLFERFIGDEADACSRLYMSADDLRRCEDAGLEIGVHGHRHLVQSRLPEREQRAEVQIATEYFRGHMGFPAVQWSYPYSAVGCWDETTKALLNEFGYAGAVTKVRAIVTPSHLQGRWELPRFDVRDVFDAAGQLVPDRLQALFVAD